MEDVVCMSSSAASPHSSVNAHTEDDLLTVSVVARDTGKSEAAVRKAADSGRLPVIRTSTGQRLFRRGAVSAFIRRPE